jgi:glycolate oxidase
VFHAGDGNLHPNISFDRRNVVPPPSATRAARSWRRASRGGSITGEHGVGNDKRLHAAHLDAETLGAMQATRRVFDPGERSNPGKVVPVHACREWCATPAARTSGTQGRPLAEVAHD